MNWLKGITYCLAFTSCGLFAQDIPQGFREGIYKIESLKPFDNKYSADLTFLDSVLHDKRIVFLGEASHGDGMSMQAKSMLINYLVQKLGFSVLIIESNIYEMQKMNSLLGNRKYDNTLLLKAGLSVHGYINEGDESLIKVWQLNKDRFSINGIDITYNSDYRLFLKSDLISAGLDRLKVKRYECLLGTFDLIAKCLSCDKADTLSREQDEFLDLSAHFLNHLGKGCKDARKNQLLWQTIKSNIGILNWIRQRTSVQTSKLHFWGPRDKYMYENFQWLLSNVYSEKKIIVSIATYHMSRNISSLPTMVDLLSPDERKQSYFLPFLSYQGRSGYAGDVDLGEVVDYKRGSASLEALLNQMGFKNCIINFNRLSSQQKQYINRLQMTPSGNLPTSAAWTDIYDGVFFIDTMTPNGCRYMTLKENQYFQDIVLK